MITWQKQGAEIKTLYAVEYITDKKDWQRLCDGKHSAPWELYQKKPFDCLDEAITFYLVRFFDNNTYDVKLFEEIQINGESVREAYIEPSGPVFDGIRSAIDMDMRNRLNKLEDRVAEQEKELEDYTAFVSAYKLSHTFGDFVAKEAG